MIEPHSVQGGASDWVTKGRSSAPSPLPCQFAPPLISLSCLIPSYGNDEEAWEILERVHPRSRSTMSFQLFMRRCS